MKSRSRSSSLVNGKDRPKAGLAKSSRPKEDAISTNLTKTDSTSSSSCGSSRSSAESGMKSDDTAITDTEDYSFHRRTRPESVSAVIFPLHGKSPPAKKKGPPQSASSDFRKRTSSVNAITTPLPAASAFDPQWSSPYDVASISTPASIHSSIFSSSTPSHSPSNSHDFSSQFPPVPQFMARHPPTPLQQPETELVGRKSRTGSFSSAAANFRVSIVPVLHPYLPGLQDEDAKISYTDIHSSFYTYAPLTPASTKHSNASTSESRTSEPSAPANTAYTASTYNNSMFTASGPVSRNESMASLGTYIRTEDEGLKTTASSRRASLDLSRNSSMSIPPSLSGSNSGNFSRPKLASEDRQPSYWDLKSPTERNSANDTLRSDELALAQFNPSSPPPSPSRFRRQSFSIRRAGPFRPKVLETIPSWRPEMDPDVAVLEKPPVQRRKSIAQRIGNAFRFNSISHQTSPSRKLQRRSRPPQSASEVYLPFSSAHTASASALSLSKNSTRPDDKAMETSRSSDAFTRVWPAPIVTSNLPASMSMPALSSTLSMSGPPSISYSMRHGFDSAHSSSQGHELDSEDDSPGSHLQFHTSRSRRDRRSRSLSLLMNINDDSAFLKAVESLYVETTPPHHDTEEKRLSSTSDETKVCFIIRELISSEKSYTRHLTDLNLSLDFTASVPLPTRHRVQSETDLPYLSDAEQTSRSHVPLTPSRSLSNFADNASQSNMQHIPLLRKHLPPLLSVADRLIAQWSEDPSADGAAMTFLQYETDLKDVFIGYVRVLPILMASIREINSPPTIQQSRRISRKLRSAIDSPPDTDTEAVVDASKTERRQSWTSVGSKKRRERRLSSSDRISSSTGDLNMQDIVIMPVQRITRYHLFLGELLKYARAPETLALVEQAIKGVSEIANLCDSLDTTLVGFSLPTAAT